MNIERPSRVCERFAALALKGAQIVKVRRPVPIVFEPIG
jgi:hypothetical protein